MVNYLLGIISTCSHLVSTASMLFDDGEDGAGDGDDDGDGDNSCRLAAIGTSPVGEVAALLSIHG